MNYTGKLYGKVGRNYIPLVMTSDDVDEMEKKLAEAHRRACEYYVTDQQVIVLDSPEAVREARKKAACRILEMEKKLAEVTQQRDEATAKWTAEKETRKNLQHVIVSSQGVDAIGRCIREIREQEELLGPLGPINDFALAQILSNTLQLPAELTIAQITKQRDTLRQEAVERGHAEWVVDSEGNTEWRWKGGDQ